MAQKKEGKVVRKTGKREKKDKDAPKRSKTSFMCFSIERRKQIVQQDPQLASSIAEVSKMIGAEWAKLTPADKEPYTKLAEEDKARYEKEKAAYEKKAHE